MIKYKVQKWWVRQKLDGSKYTRFKKSTHLLTDGSVNMDCSNGHDVKQHSIILIITLPLERI
jgi:hypothetical protein